MRTEAAPCPGGTHTLPEIMAKGFEVDLGPDMFSKRLFHDDLFFWYDKAAPGPCGRDASRRCRSPQGVESLWRKAWSVRQRSLTNFGLLAHGHAVGGSGS